MKKMQEKHSDKVLEQWIAVLAYDEKEPIFHKERKIVNASDLFSAIAMFNLMGVSYVDVIRYVDNDQIYLFNDRESKKD